MAAEYGLEGGLTFKTATSITYDKDQAGGSSLARQNLAVEISANGEVQLVTDGGQVAGVLLDVFQDKTCSVIVEGLLTFKQGAVNGVTVATPIVGATGPSVGSQTNGYVKSAPSTAAGAVSGRGIATEVHSNTAAGEVSVLIP